MKGLKAFKEDVGIMTITKNALLFLSLIFSFACATVQSGHYVMVKPTDTVDTLAKEFNVSKEKFKQQILVNQLKVENGFLFR